MIHFRQFTPFYAAENAEISAEIQQSISRLRIMQNQTRPILIYFLTIYATSVFSMWSGFGPISLIYGIGILLFVAFPIALPAFTWLYFKKKGQVVSPLRLAWSYGFPFLLISLAMSMQAQSLAAGFLLGFLTYGFPGLAVFSLQRRWLHKDA